MKSIKPYSSINGRFIVLECEKEAEEDTSYGWWKGVVLREVGKNMDDVYFCMLLDTDAKTKHYRTGDIVEAEIVSNNYYPGCEPDYSAFLVSKIRLVNKLSWLKLK